MASSASLSLRCASPLPRAEVFRGSRPTSARQLPPAQGLPAQKFLLPLPLEATKLQPISPGSSITASNGSSSVSSSNGSPTSSASAAYVAGLTRRAEAVALPPLSTPVEGDLKSTADPFGESLVAGPRPYDIFEEDDYTDRFESFNVKIDTDAAMDEYIVFSRRYETGIKMRPEVRDALPKKNGVGGGLWQRLYSDVSMQFSSCRDSTDNRVPLRKMFSDVEQSQKHHGGRRERQYVARQPTGSTLGRAISADGMGTRHGKSKYHRAQSTKSMATDEFLEFQRVRRAMRRQKDKGSVLAACKKFLMSLVPKKRRK